MPTWFWPALRAAADAPPEAAADLPRAVVEAGAAAKSPQLAFARLVRGLAGLAGPGDLAHRASRLARLAGDAPLGQLLAAAGPVEPTEAPPALFGGFLDTLARRLHPPTTTEWQPVLDPIVWRLRTRADVAHLMALAGVGDDPEAVRALHDEALDRRWLWVRVAGNAALADGLLAGPERDLVQRVAELAGLPADEAHQAIALALAEPLAPAEVAARVSEAEDRDLLLRLMVLVSLSDGQLADSEPALLEATAVAFGCDPVHLALLQLETWTAFQEHTLRAATPSPFDLPGLAYRKVEAIVRQNLGAIATELRETGDLLVLLALGAQRPLTPDEQARVNAQLLDLCRSVPALAIFALPGGALLLPLLARVLPFSLTPSAFQGSAAPTDTPDPKL